MQQASSHSEYLQRLQLWADGCMAAASAGLLAMVLPAVCIYQAYRMPPLKAQPERINPNTANLGSLVRLPGIGKARALDLMAYRSRQPQPAFRSVRDLEAIKGIGPKTAETLAPWLTFEDE